MDNAGGVVVVWQMQRQLQGTQGKPTTDTNQATVQNNHTNMQFMQHPNGVRNPASLQMPPIQPMNPMQMNWQHVRLTQLQWQQRMMQLAQGLQLQQQKEKYHMALQSQQTQLQQLRHNHMLKTLLMHNVNHPQASYKARSIVDIKPLAWSMEKPLVPGLPYHPTFLETFQLLPRNYQHALSCVSVFKFSVRPATPEEYREGLDYTPEASFFLKSLQGKMRFHQYHRLMGFRCQCCRNYGDGTYVKGSTSFVDMGQEPQHASIQDALTMRIRHLVVCPCVTDQDKLRFKRFLHFADSREKKIQETFVALWAQTLQAAHFPTTFPTTMLDVSQDAVPWHGGDPSSFSEAVVSSDLFDTLSFASQLLRDKKLTFDDMSETMLDGGFPSSLFMELVSELSVMQVTISNQTQMPEATLHCSKCQDHSHISLPSLIRKGPLQKTIPTDVRDFVLSHAQFCPSISCSHKQIVTRLAESLDDRFWSQFCTWWQSYLTKLLRGFLKPDLPRQPLGCDHFRYITLEDRKKKAFQPLPILTLPNLDPPNPPTLDETQLHFIFLHNHLYQDCAANRWFRGQISKHRPLYLQMTESVQEVMRKSILKFISKSGYSFVLVNASGTCDTAPTDQVEKYVSDSLLNGFPQVVDPPIAFHGDSKVFDVDVAPEIGLLYENIRWDDQPNSDTEKFSFPVLLKDKVEASYLEWGDVWPTWPDGLLSAIQMVNGNQDEQETTNATSNVIPTDGNAASALKTAPGLVSHPHNTPTKAGTQLSTLSGRANMNAQGGTTLTEQDVQYYKRNLAAIVNNTGSSKRSRTS